MTTAIDTNAFSRIWLGGADGEQSSRLLRQCSADGELIVCPIVQAEMLANRTMSEEDILLFLRETHVRVDHVLVPQVWVEAGLRYRAYAQRKRSSGGGDSRRLVADFVVGAHALLQAQRLLTYDVRMFQTYFPELRLITA